MRESNQDVILPEPMSDIEPSPSAANDVPPVNNDTPVNEDPIANKEPAAIAASAADKVNEYPAAIAFSAAEKDTPINEDPSANDSTAADTVPDSIPTPAMVKSANDSQGARDSSPHSSKSSGDLPGDHTESDTEESSKEESEYRPDLDDETRHESTEDNDEDFHSDSDELLVQQLKVDIKTSEDKSNALPKPSDQTGKSSSPNATPTVQVQPSEAVSESKDGDTCAAVIATKRKKMEVEVVDLMAEEDDELDELVGTQDGNYQHEDAQEIPAEGAGEDVEEPDVQVLDLARATPPPPVEFAPPPGETEFVLNEKRLYGTFSNPWLISIVKQDVQEVQKQSTNICVQNGGTNLCRD